MLLMYVLLDHPSVIIIATFEESLLNPNVPFRAADNNNVRASAVSVPPPLYGRLLMAAGVDPGGVMGVKRPSLQKSA